MKEWGRSFWNPSHAGGCTSPRVRWARKQVWTQRWTWEKRPHAWPDTTWPRSATREWTRPAEAAGGDGTPRESHASPRRQSRAPPHSSGSHRGGTPSTVPTHPRRPSPSSTWRVGVWRQGPGNPDQVSANRSLCGPRKPMAPQGQTDRGRPPKWTKLRPRCPACRSEPGYRTQGRGVVAFTSDTIHFRANSIRSRHGQQTTEDGGGGKSPRQHKNHCSQRT